MKALLSIVTMILSAVTAFADVDLLGVHPVNRDESAREIQKGVNQISEMVRGAASRAIDGTARFAGETIQAVSDFVPGPGGVALEAVGSVGKNIGRDVAQGIYPEGFWHDDIRNYRNYGVSAVDQMALNTFSSVGLVRPDYGLQNFRNARFQSYGQQVVGQNLWPMMARPRSRAIIVGSRMINNGLESFVFNSSLIADRLAQIGAYLSLETIEAIIRAGQTSERIAQSIAYQLSLNGAWIQIQTIELIMRESCFYVPVAPVYYNQFNNYVGLVVVIVVDNGSCRMYLNDQVLSTIDYPRFP